MRKLFLIAILMLGIASLAYAEIGATAYGSIPSMGTMQQKIGVYNPGTTAISSHYVVVISTNAANATYRATGSVVATTTTAGDTEVLGVVDDNDIPAGGSGQVIVRGPAKACVNTDSGALVAGATLATTTTAGFLTPVGTQGNWPSVIGRLISTTADPKYDAAHVVPVENASTYWVYIK